MTEVSCFHGSAECFPFLLVNIMNHDAEQVDPYLVYLGCSEDGYHWSESSQD